MQSVAHPADQRVVVTQRQEIGSRALDMPRRMPQDGCTQGARLADERFGADQIAKAQTGKQRFRKAADIDHAPVLIERFERG